MLGERRSLLGETAPKKLLKGTLALRAATRKAGKRSRLLPSTPPNKPLKEFFPRGASAKFNYFARE